MQSHPTKPPPHLTEPTKRWWRSVQRDYSLEQHHNRLLQAACEAWDRLQGAREVIARDGLIVSGREGPKAHPAVAIERDARIAFSRLIRELDLDSEPAPNARRGPPGLRSNSGRV
jgi:P27 family predicted phage terminase small subunit